MASSTRFQTKGNYKFPTVQLFLLAIFRVAEPIALTSIFPYAWKLVKNFEVGDQDNASFYAGLLISAFAFTEACTSMFWGSLSDRIGRKPVLLCGCVGTVLSLLIVGLATNIWVALAGRMIGGLLNGNVAVIQTMVGEIITKPEHEPRAYSIMPFVWSVGAIIGPTIGGIFSDPAQSFPNVFSAKGAFGYFPFLLPNIICAGILSVSVLVGYFWLEETHPRMQSRLKLSTPTYTSTSDRTRLIKRSEVRKYTDTSTQIRPWSSDSFSINESTCIQDELTQINNFLNPFTKQVIGLIMALGVFSYHSMTYDHLLPIFLEDKLPSDQMNIISNVKILEFSNRSGLGLSVQHAGLIISVDGLMALFIQAFIFPLAATYIGIYRLLLIVTLLHPFSFLVLPGLTHLSASKISIGIFACLALRNILSIIAYPALLILIHKETPLTTLSGRVNGLAASVGAAARTIAPPVSGYLYCIGLRTKIRDLAWYASAFVAVIGALQFLTINGLQKYSNEEFKGEEVTILVDSSTE